MKLEKCLKCEFHNDYNYSRILCKFKNNINCMTTYTDEKTGDVKVIGCPIEK